MNMKKIFSIISAALILSAAMFSSSCSKDKESLDGTTWTSIASDNSVMTLSFRNGTVELKNTNRIGNGEIAIITTGTYTYQKPNFEGVLTDFECDVPQSIYEGLTPEQEILAKALVEEIKEGLRNSLPGTLAGTVASDGKTLTTNGKTSRTFNKK